MALAMRQATRATARAAPTRARCVVVRVQKGEVEKVAAAGLALAASLLISSPADAGVVLEQPKIKKLFQEDAPAATPAPAAPKAIPTLKAKAAAPAPAAAAAPAAAPKPKEAAAEGESSDLDPRSVALPGSIVFVAGAYFALTKLDSGFADFLFNASVRDSNVLGTGYEPALKAADGPQLGTKKVKATKKK